MILKTSHPFLTHDSEPLYVANGCFGGFQDGALTQMDVWSSSIGSQNLSDPEDPVLYPVTALHTAVWFQGPYYKENDFWVGRDGLITSDPRYTADPAMPHLPQVYRCEQSLDLDSGFAEGAATLYPGSQAALDAGFTPEREIPYQVTTVFLKDSGMMVQEIRTAPDTEIFFSPDLCLEERFRLDVSGKGVCRVGTDITCDFRLRKTLLSSEAQGSTMEIRLQPEGGRPYRVRIDAPGAETFTLQQRPGLRGKGTMRVFVQISPQDEPLLDPPEFEWIRNEQKARWVDFWSRSRVKLPDSETLWQERYQASLFYVAQSIGDGPTHPGGLSKPNYPHWFGCFHDTDTYFCRPLLESGRPELPAKHLRFRHRVLPQAREIAREHGVEGAQYPWQCDLDGNGTTHHSVMNAAIIAREACFQSVMNGDEDLRKKAAEIVLESFRYLLGFTEEVEGRLDLKPEPVGTFSETMEVSKPTEALLAVRAVAESVLHLNPESAEAETARRVLRDLVPPLCDDGSLAIAPDGDPEYMRCPSVTLGGFPLHVLNDRKVLRASLQKELAKVVHVFAWLPHQFSVSASQAGLREGPASAVGILRRADAFYRDWHAVDEWENRRTGRADHFVTAAGGFATAIHHLLLAETTEGVWELFPGIPAEWRDVSFEGLVTRNGWRLSASLKGGALIRVEAEPVHAGSSPSLRLSTSFQGPARPNAVWDVVSTYE